MLSWQLSSPSAAVAWLFPLLLAAAGATAARQPRPRPLPPPPAGSGRVHRLLQPGVPTKELHSAELVVVLDPFLPRVRARCSAHGSALSHVLYHGSLAALAASCRRPTPCVGTTTAASAVLISP